MIFGFDDPHGAGLYVTLAVLAVWHIAVPLIFARKARTKGYNFWLFALPGIFLSPLFCLLLSCLLPDISGRAER